MGHFVGISLAFSAHVICEGISVLLCLFRGSAGSNLGNPAALYDDDRSRIPAPWEIPAVCLLGSCRQSTSQFLVSPHFVRLLPHLPHSSDSPASDRIKKYLQYTGLLYFCPSPWKSVPCPISAFLPFTSLPENHSHTHIIPLPDGGWMMMLMIVSIVSQLQNPKSGQSQDHSILPPLFWFFFQTFSLWRHTQSINFFIFPHWHLALHTSHARHLGSLVTHHCYLNLASSSHLMPPAHLKIWQWSHTIPCSSFRGQGTGYGKKLTPVLLLMQLFPDGHPFLHSCSSWISISCGPCGM